MLDHEPYVADPEEPRPRPRLYAVQPLLVGAIVVLIATSLTFLVLRDRAEQDPSFDLPDVLPTQPEATPEA
jgi:hypothetical protein